MGAFLLLLQVEIQSDQPKEKKNQKNTVNEKKVLVLV